MKKTIRLAVLLLTLATCVAGFTACSSGDKGHKHAYEETTVAATCTKQGYTVHKCSCGEEYVDSCVAALKHNFSKGDTCEKCGRSVSEGLEYKLNTDRTSYTVAGIGTCTDTDLIIPSTYNNLPVTSIGDHAFWVYNDFVPITSVTIPDSVTGIEQSAFSGCMLLASVTMGNGLTYIGNQAFEYCNSLMSIEIPNGVTSIGYSSFYGCMKLAEIVNESNINITLGSEDNGGIGLYAVTVRKGGSRIIEKDDYLYITGDNGTNYMLGYVGTEKELVLPEKYNRGNYEIFNLAFADLTLRSETEKSNSITSITIPDGVTKIGDYAFAYCNSLTNVTIGDGVTGIGEGAFEYCGDLEKLTIGNGVESIGSSAFSDCTVSECNEYDNGFYLGNATNSYVYLIRVKPGHIENLKINENCKFIGEHAASYCWSLGGVTFENSDGWCIPIDSSTQIYLTLTDTAENVNYLHEYGKYCWHRSPKTDVVKVSFVVDGKKINERSVSNDGSITDVPSVPEKTGYNGAWSVSDFTNITTDITVNAVYSAKTYTLTFDYDGANGNNTVKSKTVTYNQAIGDLPVPTKDGFPFGGWKIDGNTITKTTTWNIDGDKTAVAVWKKESEGLEFELNYEETYEGTAYKVTGIGTCTDTDLVVPSMYKGLPVMSIGYEAFYNCESLTSVTIGSNVERIEAEAFTCCSSLTSVTIGSGVKSIGGNAFYDCGSLISIVIPDSVTSIGSSAFRDCSSLTSVTIGSSVESIGDYAFYDCGSLISVNYTGTIDEWVQIDFSGDKSNPLYYARELYINNELVTEVKITTATKINDYAFYDYYNLTSIEIPNSVTSIGYKAFYDCDSLQYNEYDNALYLGNATNEYLYLIKAKSTNITGCIINENCKLIGCGAFYYCGSLTSITIPNSIESIGHYAFSYCGSLISVNYTGTIDEWVQIEFGYDNSNPLYYAEKLYINNELVTEANITTATKINAYAFYKCSSLTSVTIGNNVTSIGSDAFSGCTSLESVTIGNSVTCIGNLAFHNCSSLTSVTIGNGLESIGYDAFSSCDNLTSVVMNSVESIGDGAFYGCSSLVSIEIPNNVTSIGDGAFYDCDSLQYNAYDNALYLGNATNKYVYLATAKPTNITGCIINENCKLIGNGAFYGYYNLTSIEIPSNVTSIGEDAFEYCYKLVEVINKSSLNITKGSENNGCVGCYALNVKTSGKSDIENDNGYLMYIYNNKVNYLLGYVGSETNLTLPDSYNGESYEIYKYAFYKCSSLTNIVIPDSVESIGDDAFRYCNSLTSVTIGNSVESIGYDAFEYCYKLVEVINKSSLNITKGEWDNGYVGYYALNVKTSGESDIVNKDGYLFYKHNNVNYLLGYVGNETNLTLPDSYNGENYKIFKYAFADCDNLQYNEYENALYLGNATNKYIYLAKAKSTDITSCIINENCKFIGSYAFSNCSSLKSVTIGNSVESIGDYAFYDCRSLTSIEIPDSVTSIGEYAFNGCYNLQYNEYNNALYLGNATNKYLYLAEAKSTNITGCVISESCKFIGSKAFYDCDSLTSVTIGSGVESIGYEAFKWCWSLESIYYGGTIDEWVQNSAMSVLMSYGLFGKELYINNELVTEANITTATKINAYAFAGCSSLTSVTIGNGVTSIGSLAFEQCYNLTSVTFEQPDGWYVSTSSTATNGTDLDLSDAEQNATYLKSTYFYYYWYKA